MRCFYKSPFFYLPVFALLLYAAAGLVIPGLLEMTAKGDETLYALINYTGFFSVFAETFIVVPLFFVFIQQVHGFYGNLSVVLRFPSLSRLTVRHSLMSLLFCMGFVLYLYLLLLLRSACMGELAGFCSYGRFFLCSAVLQTLVLYSYAELSFLLRLLLKNDAVAFFLAYLPTVYEYATVVMLPSIPLYLPRLLYLYPGAPDDLPGIAPFVTAAGTAVVLSILKAILLEKRDWLKKQK